MNPWGVILVAVGILLIMIGITGSQHKILQVFKGIPTAARGGPATKPKAQNQQQDNQPASATNPAGIA